MNKKKDSMQSTIFFPALLCRYPAVSWPDVFCFPPGDCLGYCRTQKRDSRIQSTISGYRMEQPLYQMEVSVCHRDEQMADELYELVDHGITVLSVRIEHPIYGRLEAALNLFCRRDVDRFLESLVHENTRPLTLLTHGKHIHLLQANSEEILAQAPEILEKQGILESVTSSCRIEKTS